MNMNFKHLLASSLTLALVGCNLAAPVSQTAPIKASNAEMQALKNPSSIKQLESLKAKKNGFPQSDIQQLLKPQYTYSGARSVKGAKENISINVGMPAEMKTLFASYQDLAYIKVTVSGKITPDVLDDDGNIVTPGEIGTYTQDGGEWLAVADTRTNHQFVSATVSGVPIVDGALRVVKIWGYDANKNALPSFYSSGFYFSEQPELYTYEQGQTPDVSVELPYMGRQHMLLAAILEQLDGQVYDNADPDVDNPTLLSLLDGEDLDDLQNYLEEAMGYDNSREFFEDLYGRFQYDPMSFNAADIASDLMVYMRANTGNVPNSSTFIGYAEDAHMEVQDTSSLNITFANAAGPSGNRYLGEDLYMMINDPSSKPVHIPIGSESSDDSFKILNVAPGDWTFTIVNAAGTVLATKAVTVDDGVSITGGNTTSVTGVKELREITLNVATPNSDSKGMKRNQKVNVSFSGSAGEHLVVECTERNSFTAWVPTGSVAVSARTQNGTEVGSSTLTVGWDASASTVFSTLALSNVESADEFFVNSDREGINVGTKTAVSASGDYIVVWFKNHFTDTSVMGLYARLYSADGTPKGDEFLAMSATDMQVNSDVPYALASEALFDVGMDGQGRFVITWWGDDGDSYNVYAQVFSSSGSPVYPVPFQVHEETNGDQYFPSVAMQNDGRYVITWTDQYDYETDNGNEYDGDTQHIRGNLFDLDSALETNEFQVSTDDLWDNANDLSRVAMNANGEFSVSWLNGVSLDGGSISSDGEVTLYARTFDADANPIVPTRADTGDGTQPVAYLNQPSHNNGNFIEDSGVIEVTHIETLNFFDDMDNGGSFFGGSIFLAGGEEMVLPFLNHDIAMDDKFDANFVVTWINPGEPEVDNDPQTPGVYARYFYEETEVITGPVTVPTYKRTALKDVSDHEQLFSVAAVSERTWGERFAMSPTIDMNNSEYIISWGSVQSPLLDMEDSGNSYSYSYEHFHELFFSYAARRETNASVKARRYFRPGGSGVLWTANPIKQLNTCPLPPVMLFKPKGWDIDYLFEEDGDTVSDLYHGVFAAYPKPSVSLSDAGQPVAAWHNNDLFPDLLSDYTDDWGDGDFGGTDISGRLLNNFNL